MGEERKRGYAALIEVLEIFRKHAPDEKWPIHAEHDIVYFGGVDPGNFTCDEMRVLYDELGVFVDTDNDSFAMFT